MLDASEVIHYDRHVTWPGGGVLQRRDVLEAVLPAGEPRPRFFFVAERLRRTFQKPGLNFISHSRAPQ